MEFFVDLGLWKAGTFRALCILYADVLYWKRKCVNRSYILFPRLGFWKAG